MQRPFGLPALILLLACSEGSAVLDGSIGDAASGDDRRNDLLHGEPDLPSGDASPIDGDSGPFVAIPPCSTRADYVERPVAISTGATTYSPACLRVPAGTSVTIEASTAHPLEPRAAVSIDGDGGSLTNPIPTQITTATVLFSSPGFFPFVCPEHVDQGMTGVVWVVPP